MSANSLENETKQIDKQDKRRMKKEKVRSNRPQTKKRKRKRKVKYRKRRFPIILRVILILVLFAASLIGGLMFGYGILGDGPMKDVLEKDTWQHILNIISEE